MPLFESPSEEKVAASLCKFLEAGARAFDAIEALAFYGKQLAMEETEKRKNPRR